MPRLRSAAPQRTGVAVPADGRLQLVLADGMALDVADHHLVIDAGDGLDELVASLPGGLDVRPGDLPALGLLALLPAEVPITHLNEVDDAAEFRLDADRDLQGDRIGAQAVDHHLHRAGKVRADAVHLVDEADAGHPILVGLAPDRLRLGLDARDGVEHDDPAVEHAKASLYFGREVDVAGSVDDVDHMVTPPGGRRGRGDRDPALPLLFHPVHGGGAFVRLADFVGHAGVEQDALGDRRLPGVDVGDDADIADVFDGTRPSHDRSSVPSRTTTGSGRRRGWPPPCDGYRLGASQQRRCCSQRRGVRRQAARTSADPCARGRRG